MVLCLIDKPERTNRDFFQWQNTDSVLTNNTNESSADLSWYSCLKMSRAAGELHWPIENVIDLFSDVRSQSQELSIDPVEGSFEEVSLSGILTVK